MTSIVPPALRLASDTLDDLEALRTATGNRHRMATRDVADKDGHFRGLGLDESNPMVALTAATLDSLEDAEHKLILGLQREVRKTIFIDWIKRESGVGEKQAARLLAALGDPYINEQTGEPRTLRQLWAYAGYAVDGGAARRRRKGMAQEDAFALGKPEVKKRAYLIAKSCVKTGKRYREIYDIEKDYQSEAVHQTPCAQCGASGSPAQPGTPLRDGHKDARAVRKLAKEILRDLWLIARDHHEGNTTTEGAQ